MKQILPCYGCGNEIETNFEIVRKDDHFIGQWIFPKGAYVKGEMEQFFCGKCDDEGDAY